MFDNTQNVLHRQPTISNRSPLDSRSRRSDAPEAVPDTRPPSTDDSTGRPIRHTVQRFWKTLEHSARFQNTGRRASTTRPLRPPLNQRLTNCWCRTTVGFTQQVHDRPANGQRSRRTPFDVLVQTDLSTGLPVTTRSVFKGGRWPSRVSGLQATTIQVRRRAVRTSGHVAHDQSPWRRRVSRYLRWVRAR